MQGNLGNLICTVVVGPISEAPKSFITRRRGGGHEVPQVPRPLDSCVISAR